MKLNRREFIKSAARTGLLAMFGVAGAAGWRHKKISTKANGGCSVNPSCRGGGQFAPCTKEIKKEWKQANGVEG